MGMMLETSSRAAGASGAARTSARPTRCRPCGCARSRTRAGSRSRSRPGILVGHRRDRARARRVAVRDPRPPPPVPPRAGGDRPELPREARAPRCTRAPEPGDEEFLAAVATARVVLGPRMHLQAPPNLVDPDAAAAAARRRDRRLGRRVAAHARPREPREAVADARGARRHDGRARQARSASASRSTPSSPRGPIPTSRGRCARPVAALLGARRPGRRRAAPRADRRGRTPTSGGSRGRSTLTFAKGADAGLRDDADVVYGDFDALEVTARVGDAATSQPERLDADISAALAKAERPPADHRRRRARALPGRGRRARRALPRRRRPARRGRRATTSPTSINRNINFTNVCYVGCRFCAFAQREVDAESYTLTLDEVADRAEEAWAWGATEVCMQGGIHPDLPGHVLLRPARRREGARAPRCTSTPSARWRS